ncbi:MAG: hypothetical protein ABEJ82_03540 [Haloplanus sp.]
MTPTVVGALVTAGVLGVTHAVEPDHVAGISSLTSRYGDSRLSALVGACFGLGHVALVVAWLAVGYLVLGHASFPPVYESVGMLGVAVMLGFLGAAMTVGGLRSVIYAHDHGGETHAHVHLPFVAHAHDHGVGRYLTIGVVGALFTLSPPASMIAFSATLFPRYGPHVVVVAVVVYGTTMIATMSTLGAGVGAVFGAAEPRPRLYGATRAVAGVAVAGVAASVALTTLPAIL